MKWNMNFGKQRWGGAAKTMLLVKLGSIVVITGICLTTEIVLYPKGQWEIWLLFSSMISISKCNSKSVCCNGYG